MKALKLSGLVLVACLVFSACNSEKNVNDDIDTSITDSALIDSTGLNDSVSIDTTNKGVSTGSGQGMGEGIGTNVGGVSTDTSSKK